MVQGTASSVGRGLLESATGVELTGYEIHMGRTEAGGRTAPFLITERSRTTCADPDGALDRDGNVLGTYLHGLFHNLALRRSMLSYLAKRKGVVLPDWVEVSTKEEEYDKLAALLRSHLDMVLIYSLAGLNGCRRG